MILDHDVRYLLRARSLHDVLVQQRADDVEAAVLLEIVVQVHGLEADAIVSQCLLRKFIEWACCGGENHHIVIFHNLQEMSFKGILILLRKLGSLLILDFLIIF